MSGTFLGSPLRAAPAALHCGGGQPAPYGRYAGLIDDLSTQAWDGSGGLFSRRRLQRKGWLYFGAFSERYMVGYAVVDAGLVATAFIYVYDRERKLLVEEKTTVPFGFAADFKPDVRQPWSLRSGARHWRIDPASGGGWELNFSGQRIQARLQFDGPGRGMTSLASSLGRPFAHTYKVAVLTAQIEVTVDGQRGEAMGGGSLDFTLGYPPRHTTWNWASMDGTTQDGQRFGLNLVAHFMNGLENSLWLGDELIPLAQAVFDYDPANRLAPWRIRSEDGRVALTFIPEGQRRENLRAGLMASVFTQPFGRFEGVVRTATGEQTVRGFGVVEEHRATW